ncbi:MAG: alpha/beta hydrolase [Bacteroidia bacterium]|nr:alpha/beta hydrolase [Bacteroidia bacterium]
MSPTGSPRIYLLPGLAASERMFEPLRETGLEFTVITWPQPQKGEKYSSYLKRLADQIDQSQPFYLGGVSFGGMAAVRLCEWVSPEKLFLISTVKNSAEFPFYLKLFRLIPLQKLIPGQTYKWFSNLIFPLTVGSLTPKLHEIRNEIMKNSDPYLIRWSINQAVYWKASSPKVPLARIHGKKDIVFPRFLIGKANLIPKADHHLIMKRPEIVAEFLQREMGSGA